MEIRHTDLQQLYLKLIDQQILSLEERRAELPISLHDVTTHSMNMHIRKLITRQICILKGNKEKFVQLS